MAKLYVLNIKRGKLTLADVPSKWKEQVIQLLKEQGLDEFITE